MSQAPLASYVQVASDGSGKKIRNLKFVQVEDDGSESTVYAQVVAIVDADGNILSGFAQADLQQEILMELQDIKECLKILTAYDLKQGIALHGKRTAKMDLASH